MSITFGIEVPHNDGSGRVTTITFDSATNGSKIAAIKALRSCTGMGLRNAKDAVEALIAGIDGPAGVFLTTARNSSMSSAEVLLRDENARLRDEIDRLNAQSRRDQEVLTHAQSSLDALIPQVEALRADQGNRRGYPCVIVNVDLLGSDNDGVSGSEVEYLNGRSGVATENPDGTFYVVLAGSTPDSHYTGNDFPSVDKAALLFLS